MKRLFALIMIAILLASCLFLLSACGEPQEPKETEEEKRLRGLKEASEQLEKSIQETKDKANQFKSDSDKLQSMLDALDNAK